MGRVLFVRIAKPFSGRFQRRIFASALAVGALLIGGLSNVYAQTQQAQNPAQQTQAQQAQVQKRQNMAARNAGDESALQRGATQPEPGGFRFTPFVVFSTRYDDNIFISASNTQSDTILSVRPGFAMRYLSPRTDFHFNYGLSAAKYMRHSDLDDWAEEQGGSIGASRWFTGRFNAGINASYFETHNPQRLTPISGVVIGRNKATRATLRPAFVYEFSPITAFHAFYQYARKELSGGERTNIGTASAALTHELDPHNSLQFRYQNIHYDFSTAENVNSNLFMVGWNHDITSTTSIELSAGPRDTEGRWVPEILAGIRYRSGTTVASVAYRRTQVAVIGQTDVNDVQGLTALFGFVPVRHLSFNIRPSYSHTSGSGVSNNVWHLGFDLWYTFTPGWSVGLTESYVRQSGSFSGSDSVTRRNVVGLALRWGLPNPGRRFQGAELPVPGEIRGQ